MNKLSKQYGTEERQSELLQMIKEIDLLFRKHGIVYSLSCGSLLGAIRENGFIPWDDDMDIMVDRDNYNKICALLTDDNHSAHYGIRREIWIDRIHRKDSTDPNDASIDIFVLDNCPDDIFRRKIKILMIKILQGMMRLEYPVKHSLFDRIRLKITHIMGLPFSSKTKYEWYKAVSQIGNKKRTQYLTGYNDNYVQLNRRLDGHLMESITTHPFEDTELPIVTEYDHYLKVHYNDDNYMTPLPIDQRIPIHSGKR